MWYKKLNIIMVGGIVGKTCLVNTYMAGSFVDTWTATEYDIKSIEMTMNGHRHTIQLYDTGAHDDIERLRQMFYKQAHCFLLCYSINDRYSYENITEKWIPEIIAVKRVPIVLIATKLDLRNNLKTEVSSAEGEALKRKINANSFVECSAKQGINVELALEEAVRACYEGVPVLEKKDRCSIS
uniref:Putative ras similarity family n=1 Tax=Aedes albopictus TaxID=7160 RepID=A0A1W7R8Y5_AEDAL